jgi:hypothetical protein
MKKTLLTVLVLFSITFFYGQKENNTWKEVAKPGVESSEKYRRSTLPTDYKLFTFDYSKFIAQLNNVPNRNNFNGVSKVIVSIPNPNGKMVSYRIIETSTFEESLQAQFPEIRSFAGNAVNDASTVIRFSVSPYNGLSAIIRTASGESTYIIDPITMDNKTFIVFDRSKSKKADGSFICTTEEDITTFGPNLNKGAVNQMLNNADDGKLRKFQMAQSCTAEYSNYFGATSAAQVNLVLAAFNATYTRCNAIFEMDFNCTMELIANTTSVIYYNPSTDPYSPPANLGNWNAELGATLQSVIGNANYDIGHVFGDSGGGGNAGCIGCICSTDNSKGTAYTSPSDGNPQGDFFDVDYVAHEIGHQLGGRHTFSHSAENSTVNVEPGSGVTIMGYAGITGATDVAAHSIPIFHAATIEQITINIKTKDCAGPNTGYCLEVVNTGNAVPAPSAPATKTLPIGTAFKLTGTATDANAGDVLSYCWEQVNDATTVGAAASYPSGNKTNGPNFRSFMPKNNGTRNFPRLEDHVANGIAGNTWEIIPTINRTLAFRMTVRDNKAGGGNNESVNTDVTFNTSYGPFLITSQNTTGISYTQGSTQTIMWSVNNTTALVGSTNVNIKLSTDGGQTYTTTLESNTPNDGTQTVTIPNVSAPFCRILIEPTGNDYYAINTNNFAIGYTVNDICNTYTSSGINATIVEQSPLAYQTFNLNVPDNVIISDVDVSTNIDHRVNQLYVGINHPDLSFVQLFRQDDYGCGNNVSPLTCTFDDSGVNYACGGSASYTPSSPLDAFNGKNSQGTWRFRVADVTSAGGPSNSGILNSFSIRICYKEILETPNACGVITTTWNGSAWSNGAPLKNVVAIFNSNYTSTGDIEACSVILNTGANVTIETGHTLIVGNEVTVNGTGSLTINNNAALRQINGASLNIGNIIIKKNSVPMIRQDYTAWASPVSGQQLQSFSPNTLPNRFYQYLYTGTTTPTAYQAVTPSTNFVIGKGYMIRSADNSSATIPVAHNGQYTGVPFNGDLSVNLGKGYNLLGNPYASPIDADRFLSDNSSTVGALYFWTHTVAASGGIYPVNNFASYTTMGGTASAAGGSIPNGKVQTGQGFYVNAYDFGTAIFSNFQRLNASTTTQFYRSVNNANTVPVTEKHRIWLNLNDDTTSYNQILFGYMDGATNGFDQGIDGIVLDDSKSMIYNLLNDQEFIIQGKAMPFTDEDVVTLGLKVITAGTYNISLETLDGLFTTQDVFLKDNYTNIIHDIKQSAYVFTTRNGTFIDRFEVVYRNSVLSNEDFTNENTVLVASQNNQLTITSLKETIKEVTVFDVLGRNLYHNTNVNEKVIVITALQATSQALFVKVNLTTGETITKKMVF